MFELESVPVLYQNQTNAVLELKAKSQKLKPREKILIIEKLIFVNLGEDGKLAPHGKTEITFVRDRFRTDQLG